jgi:outer membrane lipoprotein-sorting protein
MALHARSCAFLCLALALSLARLGAQAPSTAPAQAPSVDDIVSKYLAAKGGAEKLRAVSTVKTTGRIKGPSGEVPITSWARRPNMMRRESVNQGKTFVVAFDGQTVWAINPMLGPQPRPITGAAAEMARQDASDFDSVLLDYKQKGYKVDFVGTEPVGGLSTYHLRVTKNTGRAQDVFLNAQTLLESRVTMAVEQGERKGTAVIEFSNYKPIDGIMVPFTIRQTFDGQLIGEVSYDSIQFNVPIDDGLFSMPK